MPPLDPSIALILLAAGRSERFGSDKLTVLFRGRPLWEWAAAAAESAGFESLYLVIGEHSRVTAREKWRPVVTPMRSVALAHRSPQGSAPLRIMIASSSRWQTCR